jgi:predicted acyl esterase
VDSANKTLAVMHEQVHAVDEKLNMLTLFHMLDSPHEKELTRLIELRGGATNCLNNDIILKELTAVNQAANPAAALSSLRDPLAPSSQSSQPFDPKALYAMRSELKEDIQDSLQRNMEVFERKLQVQKQQLVVEIRSVVEESSGSSV